jgi:tetratricopeptide (TPR) repeat protein
LESRGVSAIPYLQASAFYDPFFFYGSMNAHFLLGNQYAAQGWDQKAIDAYHKAIQLQEDLLAHRHLARIYIRKGDLQSAIREQHRVVELNPIFPGHLRDLAELLEKAGEPEKARQWREKANELDAIIEKKYP